MAYESWVHFHNDTDSFDFEYAETGLDELQKLIPDKIHQAIRSELRRVSDLARSSLLGESVHGKEHTGLRARIASGLNVDDNATGGELSVTVDDPELLGVPWGLDTASTGWEHPVFGRDDSWVKQKGTAPWWSGPTNQIEPMLQERIPQAIDDAVDEVFE